MMSLVGEGILILLAAVLTGACTIADDGDDGRWVWPLLIAIVFGIWAGILVTLSF